MDAELSTLMPDLPPLTDNGGGEAGETSGPAAKVPKLNGTQGEEENPAAHGLPREEDESSLKDSEEKPDPVKEEEAVQESGTWTDGGEY